MALFNFRKKLKRDGWNLAAEKGNNAVYTNKGIQLLLMKEPDGDRIMSAPLEDFESWYVSSYGFNTKADATFPAPPDIFEYQKLMDVLNALQVQINHDAAEAAEDLPGDIVYSAMYNGMAYFTSNDAGEWFIDANLENKLEDINAFNALERKVEMGDFVTLVEIEEESRVEAEFCAEWDGEYFFYGYSAGVMPAWYEDLECSCIVTDDSLLHELALKMSDGDIIKMDSEQGKQVYLDYAGIVS